MGQGEWVGGEARLRAKLWPCMAYPPVRLDPMHVCYMFWGKGGT